MGQKHEGGYLKRRFEDVHLRRPWKLVSNELLFISTTCNLPLIKIALTASVSLQKCFCP